MNTLPRLLLCGLLSIPALGTAAEPACADLQTENQALKARIQQLEAASKIAAPAPTADTPTATAAIEPKATGLAPKPANTVRVIEEEPYSRSGCRAGLFTPLPPARWMERDRWEDLKKGMSAVEVELMLGIEHYDTGGGGRIKWEYGKCGISSKAQLLFENGRLIDWRAPN